MPKSREKKRDLPKRGRRSAHETKKEIFDVAEDFFASLGFEKTRLEDIAGHIGIKRAALFYYFKDKQDLYQSTLERLWNDLMQTALAQMSDSLPLETRLQNGVLGLIDFIAKRPAFPRLVLRLGSDNRNISPAINQPFFELLEALIDEGEEQGVFNPVIKDPALLAATIAGTTVFYPLMLTQSKENIKTPTRKQITQYRNDTLRVVNRLLGIKGQTNL